MLRFIFFFFTLSLPLFAVECPDLIVVRHGTALHNVQDRYNSNPNHPGYFTSNLTDVGKKEANESAKKLLAYGYNKNNVIALYVSPLPRTRQTAQILVDRGVVLPENVIVDPEIIEWQAGDLEGKPVIHEKIPNFEEKYHAETNQHLRERVNSFYKKISNQNGNVIVVTHGAVASRLLQAATGHKYKLTHAQAVIVPLREACLTR